MSIPSFLRNIFFWKTDPFFIHFADSILSILVVSAQLSFYCYWVVDSKASWLSYAFGVAVIRLLIMSICGKESPPSELQERAYGIGWREPIWLDGRKSEKEKCAYSIDDITRSWNSTFSSFFHIIKKESIWCSELQERASSVWSEQAAKGYCFIALSVEMTCFTKKKLEFDIFHFHFFHS